MLKNGDIDIVPWTSTQCEAQPPLYSQNLAVSLWCVDLAERRREIGGSRSW